MGVAGIIDAAGRRWPSRPALRSVHDGGRNGLSWAELARRCEELVRGFRAVELPAGATVAMRCHTRPEALLVGVAAIIAGLDVVASAPDACVTVLDDAGGLAGVTGPGSALVIRGTAPPPHSSIELLAARGIAYAASHPEPLAELEADDARHATLIALARRIAALRGSILVVAPAASRIALAAVPAGALTGSPVCLGTDALAGCETFDPVSLLTTAAELERLGESLDATGRPWRRSPWRIARLPSRRAPGRRLRQVFVIDPVPDGLRAAMQDHGIAVEGVPGPP